MTAASTLFYLVLGLAPPPDLPDLAVALVAEMRAVAGYESSSTRPAVASGPLLLDEPSWSRGFNQSQLAAWSDVHPALTADGHQLTNLLSQIRSVTNSAGVAAEYFFDGDPSIVTFHGLAWQNAAEVSALVQLFYTFDAGRARQICPELYEVSLRHDGMAWSVYATERKMIC